jgi:hypothetical protein
VPTPDDAQLAGRPFAGGLDEIGHRFDRQRGVGDEDERQCADAGNRLEITQQHDRQVGTQRFIDRVGTGRQQHGMAVGLRPRHGPHGDHAATGRLRIDQHLLTPGLRQFLAEQSRHGVRARPHHDEDRPGRIVLRVRRNEVR